jgi:hypothetical protein
MTSLGRRVDWAPLVIGVVSVLSTVCCSFSRREVSRVLRLLGSCGGVAFSLAL